MARKHRIVVASHRPWLRWLLIAFGTALLALGGWGLYTYTRATTISDFRLARSESNRLRNNNGSLADQLRVARADNQQLRDELAYIKRSGQIDGDACALVKKSLSGMQQENSNLREQLAFYRGIVSPKQSSEGLRVYDLKMTLKAKATNAYDFELLLIQPIHHDHPVSGTAELVINGLQDGKRRSYPLSDLIAAGSKNLLFSFKYFQEIDGSFRLPSGFRPIRVAVTLTPGGDMAKVDESYDWAKIEQSAGADK